MKAQITNYYFDLIAKRKTGPIASLLLACLKALSLLFGAAVFFRIFFYKKPYRPKAYTFSIGNIVAGGTGKTPFAIFLAETLIEKYSVGILLRGYKARAERSHQTHVFQRDADPEIVGDEACLIAKRVPKAVMLCGKNRVAGAKLADAKKIQALVIDDGMQHLALARDVEIVMIDSQNPFGYSALLPRGLLREPVSSLKRADLVVVTCRNGRDITPEAEAIIHKYTKAPICKVRYQVLGLFDVDDKPVKMSSGAACGLFCAIAKPEQFAESLAGYNVVYQKFLPDHASIHRLQDIAQEAKMKGASCLICTEKDRVKLRPNLSFALPIYWLKIGIEIMTPAVWHKFCSEKPAILG